MAIYSEFSINSMVIFHSFLYVYQRVVNLIDQFRVDVQSR